MYSQSASLNATFKYKLLMLKLVNCTTLMYKTSVSMMWVNITVMDLKKISLTLPTLTKDHDVNLSNKVEPEVDFLLTKTEMFAEMK